MSKAADRFSKISIEDLESKISVECPLVKPEWLLLKRLFCVRKVHEKSLQGTYKESQQAPFKT